MKSGIAAWKVPYQQKKPNSETSCRVEISYHKSIQEILLKRAKVGKYRPTINLLQYFAEYLSSTQSRILPLHINTVSWVAGVKLPTHILYTGVRCRIQFNPFHGAVVNVFFQSNVDLLWICHNVLERY